MRTTRIALVVASAIGAALGIACGGGGDRSTGIQANGPFSPLNLPSCGASTALMTVSPVSYSDLLGWVPLGNLNPPGHLFPTDHQYLYINNPENQSTVRPVPVVSPGNITVSRVHRTHYSPTNTYDYAIEFALCDEVRGEFGHVTTLAVDLLAEVGAFDQQCSSYGLGVGDAVFTNCYTKPIAVTRAAGQPIGTSGGQGTSFALDFTLRDSRRPPLAYANQARWQSGQAQIVYTAPASDYFAEPARSEIRARLGAFNGSSKRTAEPVGGTIAYDVPGALRGVWFNPASPMFPEAPHVAFVPDAVDPARLIISMGISQPGYPSGLYPYMARADGRVNRDPSSVTADGNIYCFEFAPWPGVLLLRLESATSLRVEGRSGYTTCTAQEPWTFTASAFVYVR
jgi:hypothetical protein